MLFSNISEAYFNSKVLLHKPRWGRGKSRGSGLEVQQIYMEPSGNMNCGARVMLGYKAVAGIQNNLFIQSSRESAGKTIASNPDWYY